MPGLYAGEVLWGRSVWKRSAVDSNRRCWEKQPHRAATVRYSDERLRIVPQPLWERVQARRRSVAKSSNTIRQGTTPPGTYRSPATLPADGAATSAPPVIGGERDSNPGKAQERSVSYCSPT